MGSIRTTLYDINKRVLKLLMSLRPHSNAGTPAARRFEEVLRARPAAKVGGYTLLDAQKKNEELYVTWDKFRDINVNDTLSPDILDRLANPPPHYDPEYQKMVNMHFATAFRMLENLLHYKTGGP